MSTIMDEIRASRAEVRQLTNRVDKMSVGSVSQRSPTPESRRATFASDCRSPVRNDANRWTPTRNDATRGQAGGRPFRRGPSERRRRDHRPMDLLATAVVGHTTANVRQLTLTAITVVEGAT